MKDMAVARRKGSAEEAAFLDLQRTSDMLSRPLAQVLKSEDLSSTQYNILRILRGSPRGLTCGEIGSRMITRDPDITRLLDRMEKRKLVSRCRETKDRRMVLNWGVWMNRCKPRTANCWVIWAVSACARWGNCWPPAGQLPSKFQLFK
jgi:hypothetical protein